MLILRCCQFLGSRTAYVLKALQDGASGPDRLTSTDYALTVHVNLLSWQNKISKAEFKLQDKVVWLNFWKSLVVEADQALAKVDAGNASTTAEAEVMKQVVEKCMKTGQDEQAQVNGGAAAALTYDAAMKALFLVFLYVSNPCARQL